MRDGPVTRLNEMSGQRRQPVSTSEIRLPAVFPLVSALEGMRRQVGEWSRERDSNPRPSLYKSAALTC